MTQTLSQILEENDWNGYEGTDKNTTHDYINGFYENEFSKYKNKKIKVLIPKKSVNLPELFVQLLFLYFFHRLKA